MTRSARKASRTVKLAKSIKRSAFADGGAPWDVDLSTNPFEYKPNQGSDVPLANMDLYKGAALNTVPEVLPEKKTDTPTGADTVYQPEGSGGGGYDGQSALTSSTSLAQPSTQTAAPAPEAVPEVANTTNPGGWLAGKVQSAVNNPFATAVNLGVGFVPGFGLVNTLSGLLGGPTVGTALSPNKSAPAAPEKVTPSKMSMTQADDATNTTSGPGTFGGGLNTSISDATGLSSDGSGGAGAGGSGGVGSGGTGGAGMGGSGGAGVGGGGAGAGSGAGAGVGETGGPGGPDGGDRGGGDNSGGGSGSGSAGSGGGAGAGSGAGAGAGAGAGTGNGDTGDSGAGAGGVGGGDRGGGDNSGGGSGSGTGNEGGPGSSGEAGVKRGGAITLRRHRESGGPIDLTGRIVRSTKPVALKKSMPSNALINKALGVVSKKT